MKNKIAKLIDVKSIITILLICVLAIVVLTNMTVDEKIFNLFSNITTMVITYFFTRKTGTSEGAEDD